MASELRLLRKTWWTDFYHEGQRVRVSTGSADEKEARKFLTRLKAQYLDAPKRSDKTWSDALIKWLKAAPRSDSDKLSIDALGYKDRTLDKCTKGSFEEVFNERWAPATYNRYVARVAAILNLSGIKIKFDKKPVGTGRLRFLTAAEWGRLYGVLPEHLQPMALFSILTGLRRHNVTHLEWSQVNLDLSLVWLHADQTKAGKLLGVPLSPDALALLKAQMGQHKVFVFPYRKGVMVSPRRAFSEACAVAGIEDFTWHGLRHTWASWHVMRGTPLEVLRVLGGWKDLRMLMNYAHLAPSYVAGFAGNAVPWSSQSSSDVDQIVDHK